ncbi:MAG: sensor histidine kinase [Caldilineaceae bacterium]
MPNTNTFLAPGLLQVLQRAVFVRLALILVTLSGLAVIQPEVSLMMRAVAGTECGLLLVLVTYSGVRRRLGRRFLPVALAWFLVAPFAERIAAGLLLGSEFGGVLIYVVWAGVPVVLAAWQYRWRGLIVSSLVLVAGYTAIGLLIIDSWDALVSYVFESGSLLATIWLMGYVTVVLVDAMRKEQDALEAAHRQLARRTPTVEQLAESRERNRLAREIHDTLAHSLSGLSVQLQALATLMDHDPEAATAQLREAQVTVRSGMNEARQAIASLRAAPLQDLGLAEALRQLCEGLAQRLALPITCDVADLPALDPIAEQTIYRVAEAALANVAQHANADHILVRLTETPHGSLLLTVEDNGDGFDPSSIPPDRYGITGMRERAALIGGSLYVSSAPGQGTTIRLEVEA